ncbi:beta-hexosaminidase [Tessaracoccus aquimaris]|uniref:beta-N-acetylhexosaminidase n=1 Tax=Tessaracoccus aquimaris TaxID=1332264 RepID=A0A1Q2CSB9_9ACTN|nr:beta-N-acetylhexosaminidase [Tessaracoccus aquimaris]AQP48900.1 beta-hexosaminidase [Tessaracoccus aquimaris]
MRLLPTPTQVDWNDGEFPLPNPLPVRGGGPAAQVLSERLNIAAGLGIDADGEGPGVEFIRDETLGAEAYRLTVDGEGVRIASSDDRGAGWAVQTLLQLLPVQVHGPGPMQPGDLRVPHVEILDAPTYGWRGSHIDVVRHFFPVEALLRHLDVMAMHKLNVLHLHLTDDQGWRLPVAKYPRLAEVAAWRPGTLAGHHTLPGDILEHDGRPHGGSYTEDDLRRLVAAADRLGIMVVPEIDMPGHMEAVVAAYPEFGACDHVQHPRTSFAISEHVLRLDEASLQFCRDALDAAMDLFPGSPIHIGGDECPGSEWFADPASVETMARIGATDAASAQAWFEREMCEHVTSAGRTVIAWDEVLDGGAPDGTVVMAWRNREAVARASAAGHDVIAAPVEFTYFDYSQYEGPEQPLAINGPTGQARVAELTQVLREVEGPGTLLGGQFQLWTEYIPTWARAEYNLWPRGASVAQQLWAGDPAGTGSVAGLGRHLDRLTAAEVNWCRPPREDPR